MGESLKPGWFTEQLEAVLIKSGRIPPWMQRGHDSPSDDVKEQIELGQWCNAVSTVVRRAKKPLPMPELRKRVARLGFDIPDHRLREVVWRLIDANIIDFTPMRHVVAKRFETDSQP